MVAEVDLILDESVKHSFMRCFVQEYEHIFQYVRQSLPLLCSIVEACIVRTI